VIIDSYNRRLIDIARQDAIISVHQRLVSADPYIIRAQRVVSEPYIIRAQRIGLDLLDSIRRFTPYNRFHEPAYLHYNNELHRIRQLYAQYVDSLDSVKLKKSVTSAIEKLLHHLKPGLNHYYHLIQILREQKRLQHKIKSLLAPIKIIPDSLRPIKSIT
jgi:hypothetical protein